MKILGIGNAIVDVICKVDDNFIIQNVKLLCHLMQKRVYRLIFNTFQMLL